MPPETTPWYRSAAATSAAGLLGLALIAILVTAVVTMSSKWNTSENDSVVPPGTYIPQAPHVAKTTSASSTNTSYPTVRLSTTDIGLPGESTTSGTTPSSAVPSSEVPPSERVAPTFPGSFPTRVTNPPGTRGPRTGPRLNETRTASP